MNLNAITLDQVFALVGRIIGWGLMLMLLAAIAQRFGARLPMLPAIDHVTLAYLAGAYWLMRK